MQQHSFYQQRFIRPQGVTLAFGLYLEKRLQTATFNPAVFRADILASMFDTLKEETDLNTLKPTQQINVGVMRLRKALQHL